MFERVARDCEHRAVSMKDGTARHDFARRILPVFGRECGVLQKILLNSVDPNLFQDTEQELLPGTETSLAIATWRLRPEGAPIDISLVPEYERPEYLINDAGLALDVQLKDASQTVGEAKARLMISLFVGAGYLASIQNLHKLQRDELARVMIESGACLNSPAAVGQVQANNPDEWLDAYFVARASSGGNWDPIFDGLYFEREFPCPMLGSDFIFSVLSLASIFFAVLDCVAEGAKTTRLTQWLDSRHIAR